LSVRASVKRYNSIKRDIGCNENAKKLSAEMQQRSYKDAKK
jgi:hypothetical protein